MPNRLEPIKRVNLFREALSHLEGYIASLAPGDQLPSERQLAADLNVSRPLVRQVLKVLEELGRLEIIHGVGTFVRDDSYRVAQQVLLTGLRLDSRLTEDLYPVRRAIESEVLRSAFACRTPDNIAHVEAVLTEPSADLDGGSEVRMDLRFEAAFGDVCGNEILRRLQGIVHGLWLAAHLAQNPKVDDQIAAHHDHEGMLDAYRSGDLAGALDILETHLLALVGNEAADVAY